MNEKEYSEWLKQQPKCYSIEDVNVFLEKYRSQRLNEIKNRFLGTFKYGSVNSVDIDKLPRSLRPPDIIELAGCSEPTEWG